MITTLTNHAGAIKKGLFFLPLCVLILSAFANIIMAANVSDVGASTHAYEAKTVKMAAHNDEMLQTLASKQSLGELKQWAISQGFVPTTHVTVVTPSTPKIASVGL